MFKRLLRSRAARIVSARLLEAYLRFALRSTRWSLLGAEHLPRGEAAIVAFWHECLPLMPMMWLLARRHGAPGRAHVLVSRHRDGRLIADVLRGFDAGIIEGSSETAGRRERGGAAGLRRSLRALAAKDYVVITPDGPRGPARRAAPGLAALAALSGAPVLPAAACMRPCVRINSWDRMMLPLPFGRGAIVCGPPLRLDRAGRHAPNAAGRIAAALTDAADQAARRCRA